MTPKTKVLRRYAKVSNLEHEGFTNPATWLMYFLMNNWYDCVCKIDEMYRLDSISAASLKQLVKTMKEDKSYKKDLELETWVWSMRNHKLPFGKAVVATSIDWEQIADEFRKES